MNIKSILANLLFWTALLALGIGLTLAGDVIVSLSSPLQVGAMLVASILLLLLVALFLVRFDQNHVQGD